MFNYRDIFCFGIICHIYDSGTIVTYNDKGEMYYFTPKSQDTQSIGHVLFFPKISLNEESKMKFQSQYLSIDDFVLNHYGDKFVDTDNYILRSISCYSIISRTFGIPYWNEYKTSEKENLLIDKYINQDKMTLSNTEDFKQLFNELNEYIDNMDVHGILDTYRYICSNSGVLYHPDETVFSYSEEINTSDEFILQLFRNLRNDYKVMSKCPIREPSLDNKYYNWHSCELDSYLIKTAKDKYSRNNHLLFLLQESMENMFRKHKSNLEYLKNWPTNYYTTLLASIPENKLQTFISMYNRSILTL